MSANFATVAEAATEGKNIVITTAPGIGTVAQTLFAIEEAGLSIGLLNIVNHAGDEFGLPFAAGDEVKWEIPEMFLNSDVLVLDGGQDMAEDTIKNVTELMTSRTLHGNALPAVKAIVLITAEANTDADTFAGFDNTVRVDFR